MLYPSHVLNELTTYSKPYHYCYSTRACYYYYCYYYYYYYYTVSQKTSPTFSTVT